MTPSPLPVKIVLKIKRKGSGCASVDRLDGSSITCHASIVNAFEACGYCWQPGSYQSETAVPVMPFFWLELKSTLLRLCISMYWMVELEILLATLLHAISNILYLS